jgi:hypothetical protein
VRRHAKAPSAGSTSGIGSSRGLFGRSLATRGASTGIEGSGAPSSGRIRASVLALTLGALCVLALAPQGALAAKNVVATIGANAEFSSGATGGLFSTPRAVVINQTGSGGVAAGSFYVVDSSNNRIQQFGPGGAFVRAWGWGVKDGEAEFQVCNVAANCKAGSSGSNAGQMSTPQGIAINQASGNLFVSDQGNRRIDIFGPTGIFQGAFGWGALDGSAALQFCTSGVGCHAPGTTAPATGNVGGGQFGEAIGGLAVDASGKVYVADKTSRRIDVFTPTLIGTAVTGVSFTSAYGWGANTSAAAFEVCTTATCKAPAAAGTGLGQFAANSPTEVAIDSEGNVFALDAGNNRVQEFSSVPAPITATFGSAALTAAFGTGALQNLAIDSANHVYVSGANSANAGKVAVLEMDHAGSAVETHGTSLAAVSSNGLAVAPASLGGNIYLTSGKIQGLYVLNNTVPTIEPATGLTAHSAVLHGTVVSNNVEVKYHFEYSRDSGVTWTKFPAADATVPATAGSVAVEQTATELFAKTAYLVRLVATRPSGGFALTSAQLTVETLSSVPTITEVAADSVDDTTARLVAVINPETQPTSYHFEYGTDASYGTTVPSSSSEASAGSGSTTTVVTESISGLQPSTTYHFRVVATNATGTSASADETFTTSAIHSASRSYELVTPADDESYDANPTGNNVLSKAPDISTTTPDGRCMTYELGSQGTPPSVPGMLVDGDALDPLVACRTPEGWTSRAPGADRTDCVYNGQLIIGEGRGVVSFGLSADGKRSLLLLGCAGDQLDLSNGLDQQEPVGLANNPGVWGVELATNAVDYPTGAYNASGEAIPRTDHRNTEFIGGSADLQTLYFFSGGPLLPGVPDSASQYMWKHVGGTAGTTTLISKTEAGVPVTASAVATSRGRPGAVSEDGSAITFTTAGKMVGDGVSVGDLNSVDDVYQVRNGQPIWISKTAFTGTPQTAAAHIFEAATPSGRQVVISSNEKMVGNGTTTGDLDTVKDLYLYNEEATPGQELSRVSVADPSCAAVPGTCNDNASTATSNSGGVGSNGSAANFAGLSNDGTHVFFTSGDVLNPLDTDSQESLYVRNLTAGTTAYIAAVGINITSATTGTDAGTATGGSLVNDNSAIGYKGSALRVSEDGKVAEMTLTSNETLPTARGGTDSDKLADLYIWREEGGPAWQEHLRRVRQSFAPAANTSTVETLGCGSANCRRMTANGSAVFFMTNDTLVSEDTDHGAPVLGAGEPCLEVGATGCDVYEIETSTGRIRLVSAPGSSPLNNRYGGTSASGSDVFVYTGETLDPSRDVDRGHRDIYDARTGPVFPPAPGPTECSGGDTCQGPAANAPFEPSPGSASNVGPSNPTPVYHQKKKHHKKHHKKKHHKKRHATRKHG